VSIINANFLQAVARANRDLSLFSPDAVHRRIRAQFWASYSNSDEFIAGGASSTTSTISLATALRYGADRRISDWWSLPGFVDWFTNSEDFAQRVEFLAQLALDDLEEILIDPEARKGDKLAAAKMILEVGGKFPGRKANDEGSKFSDEKIAQMSKGELLDFISKSLERQDIVRPTTSDLPDPTINLDRVTK
jgi:hypothetical protein